MPPETLAAVAKVADSSVVGAMLVISVAGFYYLGKYLLGVNKDHIAQLEKINLENTTKIQAIHDAHQLQITKIIDGFAAERKDLLTAASLERKETLLALNALTLAVQEVVSIVEKRAPGALSSWVTTDPLSRNQS